MNTKLFVTVSVDLDLAAVTIRVAGTLNIQNTSALLAVISRAERTLPGFIVRLDLGHPRTASPQVLRLLQQSNAELTVISKAPEAAAPPLQIELAA